MDKLQANVQQQAMEAGDNDAKRAKMQQDEMDRHYAEAERVKQQRLKQLRLETQAYLFKQMAEKDNRKNDDKDLETRTASRRATLWRACCASRSRARRSREE